ncbi:site-2 protease family protein [Qipengyuania marisflavi]|uniref:Site-2 protease family protein n=1 Tax=Qipengyuania marisflavi TaxID=2486356 RepID=A0A5S3P2M6_9SPHN|nr:site-2 protease family protein [Qipengyuania marisflavi]TMM46208.1 site-2 protease family protein [Qipengyuania marisflavi]
MTEMLGLAAILIPCLIVAIVFHEVAHGLVANMLGDPTAREQKRLSLNPLRHVDPVGTLLVPGFLALVKGPIFGWAKPVPVIKERLRNPRFGMVAVAAAGPASNLLLALIGAAVLGLMVPTPQPGVITEPSVLLQGMYLFITINVFLAFFNLLPIPPFDGSHIVEGLMPPSWAKRYEKLRPFGMMAFFALIALTWFAPGLGVIENTVGPPVNWMIEQYLGIAAAVAGQ